MYVRMIELCTGIGLPGLTNTVSTRSQARLKHRIKLKFLIIFGRLAGENIQVLTRVHVAVRRVKRGEFVMAKDECSVSQPILIILRVSTSSVLLASRAAGQKENTMDPQQVRVAEEQQRKTVCLQEFMSKGLL